jgi:hypothetical protein
VTVCASTAEDANARLRHAAAAPLTRRGIVT